MAFTVHNVVQHEAQAGEAEAYGRFYEKCDVLVVHNGLSKAELEQSLSSKAPAATIMPHGCYSKRPAKKAEKRDPVCFLSLGVMRKTKVSISCSKPRPCWSLLTENAVES